jgi:hypothetical protein
MWIRRAQAIPLISGNVRGAFTVPLVPSSQRYLFEVRNVVSVSGAITQHYTTQYVRFAAKRAAKRGWPSPSLSTIPMHVDSFNLNTGWSRARPPQEPA